MKKVLRHPILYGTACFSLVAALMYGCKDFLSKAAAPQGVLTGETVANLAGVEGSLIAAYRALDWNNGVGGAWGDAASNWVWGSVTSDDAYKGSEASDQPPINDIEAYHWSTGDAESYLNDKWRGAFEGVVRSNATINLLHTVQTNSPGVVADADAHGIEGEALVLRAHYHFDAYRMWGAIPYYKEGDTTDFRKANDLTTTQIVDLIIADLDSAIKLLPASPRKGQKGRVTSWTAKAYKGRVQAYDNRWAAAQTTLRDVRTNGPYALETSYDRVWTGFVTNGPETILAYQASANDGEPNGNNANYGERLNFPHGASHSGCCGFHQPSQNLVNFFAVDALGLPLALTSPLTWNANNTTVVAGDAQAFDPRLDWTVGRDLVPYKDWGVHQPGWIRAPLYGGRYSPKKNAHEIASGAESNVGWVNTQLNAVNIHIFRYADALLLLAEADIESPTPDLVEARTIINQIRARAGVTVQGCGTTKDSATNANYPQCALDANGFVAVPMGHPSVTWATYRVGAYPAFVSAAEARTALHMERRLELAMEGQRFFDLRRWGFTVADTTLNGYLNNVGGGNEKARQAYLPDAEPFTQRHMRFPIPAIQIELSKVAGQERLIQNPGW